MVLKGKRKFVIRFYTQETDFCKSKGGRYLSRYMDDNCKCAYEGKGISN